MPSTAAASATRAALLARMAMTMPFGGDLVKGSRACAPKRLRHAAFRGASRLDQRGPHARVVPTRLAVVDLERGAVVPIRPAEAAALRFLPYQTRPVGARSGIRVLDHAELPHVDGQARTRGERLCDLEVIDHPRRARGVGGRRLLAVSLDPVG